MFKHFFSVFELNFALKDLIYPCFDPVASQLGKSTSAIDIMSHVGEKNHNP